MSHRTLLHVFEKEWAGRTPAENRSYIEKELLPKLIEENAMRLCRREEALFAPEEEKLWTQIVAREKKRKMPISLGIFLAVVFALILITIILFVRCIL